MTNGESLQLCEGLLRTSGICICHLSCRTSLRRVRVVAVLPVQRSLGYPGNQSVSCFSTKREEQDARDQSGGTAGGLSIDQQKTETVRRPHEFCGHYKHPSQT